MEIVISFLVTVAAGVTCHLICKWLDRHDRDNKQPSGRSTTEIKREEPSNVLAVHPGARSLFTWNIVISFLPTGIIAYADQEINMQVILKQIKKSKLSPWFMPCFSKNGSVDRFIVFSRYTSLAIASFAMKHCRIY